MRTTLREKAVLWVNGLSLAVGLELLAGGAVAPLSSAGLALIVGGLAGLTAFTALTLRGRSS